MHTGTVRVSGETHDIDQTTALEIGDNRTGFAANAVFCVESDPEGEDAGIVGNVVFEVFSFEQNEVVGEVTLCVADALFWISPRLIREALEAARNEAERSAWQTWADEEGEARAEARRNRYDY